MSAETPKLLPGEELYQLPERKNIHYLYKKRPCGFEWGMPLGTEVPVSEELDRLRSLEEAEFNRHKTK